MELAREDKEYYKGGDRATVIEFRTEPEDSHARVLWSRTGVVSDLPKATWMCFARVVQKGGGIADGSPKHAAAGYVNGQAAQAPQMDRAPLKVGQRARVEG